MSVHETFQKERIRVDASSGIQNMCDEAFARDESNIPFMII
jgi:hypothetical protein